MDKGTEYPFDLGTYHRVIITSSPAAQQWFNRGLNWTYAFNHEEAVNCFRRAIASDPECVLAYWGLAYALGPNYNKPWESFEGRELQNCLSEAYMAVQRASEIINNKAINMTNSDTNIMLVEQALIKAIQFRYPSQSPGHDHSIWNMEYANAMRTVCHEYPNDLDIAALFADALMNITPWNLWNLKTGEPAPGANTIEIKEVLEKNALSQPDGPKHPGVLHMYIHLMEMSGTPESALRVSDNLRGLVPDAGHLNHMPSHLDVLCGEYRQAIMSNTQAIHADEKYVSIAGPLNFYTLYRAHNYHFRLYAAMLAGISGIALETVAKIETCIPEELLRVDSPPMADWLEGFLGMRVHVLIRFGQWEDILALEVPEYQDLYCFTTAMIHYGKGIANAILGKTADAQIQQDLFTTASKRVPSSRTIFNNTCTDILAIGQAMLAGEIDYRSGNIEQGFSNLKKAIALDDGLPYDEPWGWMQPPRHAYGALLLEQGRVQEALEVYEADLGISGVLPRAMQHPNNVWSLHGLYECLITLGRGNEASLLKRSLDLAVAVADVPIKSSCFCRLDRCH